MEFIKCFGVVVSDIYLSYFVPQCLCRLCCAHRVDLVITRNALPNFAMLKYTKIKPLGSDCRNLNQQQLLNPPELSGLRGSCGLLLFWMKSLQLIKQMLIRSNSVDL